MIYTGINNFFLSNIKNVLLVHTPSRFTATEVKYLKQLLQKYSYISHTSEQVSIASSDFRSKKIAVDFEKTIFINNEGLIGLCQIIRLARDIQIDLRFLSFSPQVKMVLSLVGLEHYLIREI